MQHARAEGEEVRKVGNKGTGSYQTTQKTKAKGQRVRVIVPYEIRGNLGKL